MSEAPIDEAPAQESENVEVDWKAKFEEQKQHSRRWESRAKENASAAEKLAELEKAQMTEAEKANQRLVEAERKAQEAEARAIRYQVATEKGLSKDDADLFLTGTDAETIARQADALTQRLGQRTTATSREGANPRPQRSAEVAFLDSLTGRG